MELDRRHGDWICPKHGKHSMLVDSGHPHIIDCPDCFDEDMAKPAIPLKDAQDFAASPGPRFLGGSDER